jgi:hypothetical protein
MRETFKEKKWFEEVRSCEENGEWFDSNVRDCFEFAGAGYLERR